jgi:hypothetical protein
LPGLDFRTSYELFQGDPMSDTAVFQPYRTDVGVSFGIDGKSALVGLLGRLLLGKRSSGEFETDTHAHARGGGRYRPARCAASAECGRFDEPGAPRASDRTGLAFVHPVQRGPAAAAGGRHPDRERSDHAVRTQKAFGIPAYDRCVLQAQSAPPTGLTSGQSAIGAPVFITPPTQNVSGSLSFNITPKWAAQWSSQYDITRSRFAAQQIGLQRELHDWNAVFSFTQAPNGNFAFTFNIASRRSPT